MPDPTRFSAMLLRLSSLEITLLREALETGNGFQGQVILILSLQIHQWQRLPGWYPVVLLTYSVIQFLQHSRGLPVRILPMYRFSTIIILPYHLQGLISKSACRVFQPVQPLPGTTRSMEPGCGKKQAVLPDRPLLSLQIRQTIPHLSPT